MKAKQSPFWSTEKLLNLQKTTKYPILSNLIKLYLESQLSKSESKQTGSLVLDLTTKADRIYYENLEIGHFLDSGKTFAVDPQANLSILSLNTGGFCLTGEPLEDSFETHKKEFFTYLNNQPEPIEILCLQDFPEDKSTLQALANGGYDIYYYPHIFHESKSRDSAGVGIFLPKHLGLDLYQQKLLIHPESFPRHSFLQLNKPDTEQIAAYTSVIQVWKNPVSKTFYIFSNTHIAYQSKTVTRLNTIQNILHEITKIQFQLGQEYPEFSQKVFSLGDHNLYGIDTLIFRNGQEPVQPGAFKSTGYLSLLQSFSLFKNSYGTHFGRAVSYPNQQEVKKLQNILKKFNYKVVNQTNHPILLDQVRSPFGSLVESFIRDMHHLAPKKLQSIFRTWQVAWILDIVMCPEEQAIQAWIDPQPFGKIDHCSLRIKSM